MVKPISNAEKKQPWRALPKSWRYLLVQKNAADSFSVSTIFMLKAIGLLKYVWPFSGHETMTGQQLTNTATNT